MASQLVIFRVFLSPPPPPHDPNYEKNPVNQLIKIFGLSTRISWVGSFSFSLFLYLLFFYIRPQPANMPKCHRLVKGLEFHMCWSYR